MAFRSIGTEASVPLLSSGMTLGSPPGYQVGDLLLAFLSEDRAAVDAANITFTGWTLIGEIQHGADSQNALVYGRKATGSDNFSLSTTSTSAQTVGVAAAWSGRDADAFLASPVTYRQSFTNSSSGTPYAITATGVTASAEDDIVAFIELDQFTATDTWTFSTITSYTKQLDYQPANTTSITIQTRDNVLAGATGSLTLTATRTAGASNANAGGWVLRLPKGTGGSPSLSILRGSWLF